MAANLYLNLLSGKLIFMSKRFGIALLAAVTFLSFRSACQSWNLMGPAGFTVDFVGSFAMAMDGNSTPYVVFEDAGDDDEATVMKYNGSSWETVGLRGFSVGNVQFTDIAIDNSGTPYVVFQDSNDSGKATVMKYNGSRWAMVGTEGFSASQVLSTSIAIDSSGNPYVVYVDGANGYKATVMKYNSSNWTVVGDPGFSPGFINNCSIVIGKNGVPYVLFVDSLHGYRTTVMMYNDTDWVTVGNPGFSAGEVFFPEMAIDRNGTPYVGFPTYSGTGAGTITVMKYNGSTWETLGSVRYSSDCVLQFDITVDSCCTPYIAFCDSANESKAMVMKFVDTSWQLVGTAGFSAGNFDQISIIISNGIPYVSYVDYANGQKPTMMKYSFPNEVQNVQMQNVQLYPNPTISQLTITNAAGMRAVVYDVIGKVVYGGMLSKNKLNIDVSFLPPGFYVLQLSDEWGNRMEKKVVKE